MSKVLVLTVDFIKGIGQSSGIYAPLTKRVQDLEVIEHANKVILDARQKGYPIAHIRLCFRSKYPDVSPHSKVFSVIKEKGLFVQSDLSSDFIDGLDVHPDDIIIDKKRISPFYGTDLDLIIRSLGVDELWIMGLSTVNGVQAAARDAHDRDLKVKIFADATQAFNDAEQEMILNHLSKLADIKVMQSH